MRIPEAASAGIRWSAALLGPSSQCPSASTLEGLAKTQCSQQQKLFECYVVTPCFGRCVHHSSFFVKYLKHPKAKSNEKHIEPPRKVGWSSMLPWPWWMQGAAMRDPSSPRSSPSRSALAKRGWGTLLWRKKSPMGTMEKGSTKRIKKMKMIRMIFLVKHYIQKWSNIAKNLPAKGAPPQRPLEPLQRHLPLLPSPRPQPTKRSLGIITTKWQNDAHNVLNPKKKIRSTRG